MFSFDIVQAIQDTVLDPSIGTAFSILIFAIITEFVGILPSVILISGQLIFLKGVLTAVVATKLFFFVALPIGIGTAIGSSLIYLISYYGGQPVIEKYGKNIRLSWQSVEKLEKRFQGTYYDEIIFLVLRAIPALPTVPVTAAAGVFRMRMVPYLVLTAIGITARMMIMFVIVGLGAKSL